MGMAASGWGTTLTMDWVSPGNNPVGYFYVSPYTAQVQGTSQLLTLYCIDFNHEVAPPLEWQANLQTFDQANVPNMQYGGLPNPSNTWVDYEAAAYLVTQMAQALSSPTPNLYQSAVDQYAAWEIFLDSSHTALFNQSVAAAGGSGFSSAITAAYNNAFVQVAGGYTPTGFDILTPDPAGTPGSTQEFLVFANDAGNLNPASTPEPSSIALLATVLAGCWFYVRRRTKAKNASF
jgi:hypothetical protein